MPSRPDKNHMSLTAQIRAGVERLQRRLQGEEGFTLVELTIVLLILGILLTIAVPSYLSFKDRASKTAAKAEVAQAMRSRRSRTEPTTSSAPRTTRTRFDDTTDIGYENISFTLLWQRSTTRRSRRTAGAPYVLNPAGFTGTSLTDFCLTAVAGRWIAVQHGPGSSIEVGSFFTPGHLHRQLTRDAHEETMP